MCMNCGCGQPHENHGVEANITAADLERAAEANSQTLQESAQHMTEAVALLDGERTGDRGLAKPAGPAGAAVVGDARGTPATES